MGIFNLWLFKKIGSKFLMKISRINKLELKLGGHGPYKINIVLMGRGKNLLGVLLGLRYTDLI
jgi:hypothetical protein